MTYPLTKILIAFAIAYATARQEVRQGLKQQLTIKNMVSRTATAALSGLACTAAHEYGHLLTARYFGAPSTMYTCFGAPPATCTPANAWFSLGNFHLAGADMQAGCTADHTLPPGTAIAANTLNNGQTFLMLLAGPCAGLLAHAGIKRLSNGRIENKHVIRHNLISLWPSHVTDVGQIFKRIPPLAPLLDNKAMLWSDLFVQLGLAGYALWPRYRATTTTEKPQTSLCHRLSKTVRTTLHPSRLALLYCNQALMNNLNIPMHFDNIKMPKTTLTEMPKLPLPAHKLIHRPVTRSMRNAAPIAG